MNICAGCFGEFERLYPLVVNTPQPIQLTVCPHCVGVYLSLGREAQARAQALPPVVGSGVAITDGESSSR